MDGLSDTIFALASGRGRAGVAVIRVSGPAAAAALLSLTGRPPPPVRRATLRRLHDAAGDTLDAALVLWFEAPGSLTGEDVAELHVHGGVAVVGGVMAALAAVPGLRPAEPGEFARRAVGHGRLDLTQAEAIADLVQAETAAQRRQAIRQMEGGLARLYDGWRGRLTTALAHLEATIDFADEDLPVAVEDQARAEAAALAAEIARHLDDAARGERIRDGITVAVFGPANAGKSTLVNALAGRDVAIVSGQPGTTRDVIEVPMDIAGFAVVLSDSAGLGTARDPVEAEGVRRAAARAAAADLRIAVLDAGLWPMIDPATAALIDAETLVVLNKTDLRPVPPGQRVGGRPALAIAARTGDGLVALRQALAAALAARFAAGETPPLTRLRHRQALAVAAAALERGRQAAAPEAAAEEWRAAAAALGRITGRVDVESVLDAVFRDFCIGK
jgi:tRNA modification GTPase